MSKRQGKLNSKVLEYTPSWTAGDAKSLTRFRSRRYPLNKKDRGTGVAFVWDRLFLVDQLVPIHNVTDGHVSYTEELIVLNLKNYGDNFRQRDYYWRQRNQVFNYYKQ